MRESLKKSLAHSPAGENWEKYPKGSLVLCNACSLPIFRLDRGVALGDKMGQMASAFKPLTLGDLLDLRDRPDIDPGVRALAAAMTPRQRAEHVAKLHEIRSGDPATCPCCKDCFVQVVAVEKHEVLDKAYTVELLTIPPKGMKSAPVRGRNIVKDWVH